MAAAAILAALIAAVGLFFVNAGITFIVWNVLAHYFGFKAITFGIAIAIQFALGVLRGVKVNFNKE